MGVGMGEGNSLMGERHFPKEKVGTSKVMVGFPHPPLPPLEVVDATRTEVDEFEVASDFFGFSGSTTST